VVRPRRMADHLLPRLRVRLSAGGAETRKSWLSSWPGRRASLAKPSAARRRMACSPGSTPPAAGGCTFCRESNRFPSSHGALGPVRCLTSAVATAATCSPCHQGSPRRHRGLAGLGRGRSRGPRAVGGRGDLRAGCHGHGTTRQRCLHRRAPAVLPRTRGGARPGAVRPAPHPPPRRRCGGEGAELSAASIVESWAAGGAAYACRTM